MGSRHLLAIALLSLTGLPLAVLAQGPLYRERWADLHLELLRERVLLECAARDDDTLAEVAALSAVADPNPFLPAARALARLRGVACDDLFALRASLGAFVLPEVVDPDAQKEECRSLQLTMMLPYTLPVPKEIGFEAEVVDGKGAVVFSATFGEGLDFESLRADDASVSVPGAQLEDGAYRVRLRTLVGGKAPGPNDPAIEHVFSVLRGYQQRAERAQTEAVAKAGALSTPERAVLRGLALEVARAYGGEAFDGRSEAVADLVRLETALANLAAEKPLLDGLRTRLPAALPAGGDSVVGAVLRWPTAPEASERRLPLVVVLGGMPSYDVRGRRPSWPEVRTARWVERRCGDFGLGDAAVFAWLQSPGGGLDAAKALPEAIAALHTMLPTDGTTTVVAELESAAAICFVPDLLKRLHGLALVGAGAFSRDMLAAHAGLSVLGVTLSGHPSGQGLEFTQKAAAAVESGKGASFELTPARPRPWTSGAAGARAEIAKFLRACLRPR